MASELNDGGAVYPHDGQANYTGGISMRQRYKLAAMEALARLSGDTLKGPPNDAQVDIFVCYVAKLTDALLAEDAAWAKGQEEKSDDV